MKSNFIRLLLILYNIISFIFCASVIEVTTVESLHKALLKAKPGIVISIAPGTYDYSEYQGSSKFYGTIDGTKLEPITLTAQDPKNPPVLTGSNVSHNYVLHITGDYWIIENLKITNSQKGIVLDNSNYSIVRNCEISMTGAEAIAIRDGSSNCLIQKCNIHDTGLITPGYGEGIYIGSSQSTTGFDYKCDNNKVDSCTFKNIAAEHIDIKEYTTGTEVFGCIFYGDGMSGANYAGSFVDIAGNDCYVHDNVGYRKKNKNIVAAFEVHRIVENWGDGHLFENNVLYMDRPYGEINTSRRMYVVDGWDLKFSVKNNKVDYGNGLVDANSWEYFNSDYVTYLK